MFKRIIIILVFVIVGYTLSDEIMDFNKSAHSFLSENQMMQNVFGENEFYQEHFGVDAEEETITDVIKEGINIEISEAVQETNWAEELNYIDDGYYYSILETQEQVLYGEILSTYENYGDTVNLGERYSDMSSDAVHKVHWYVLLDHPEIYWVDEENSITYYDVEGKEELESLHITMNYDMEQIATYDQALETVIAAAKEYSKDAKNSYEKAISVYQYLILNCKYDEESATKKMSEVDEAESARITESGTIIGSLIHKEAVCSGYAKAYDYLLEALGIECFSVIGYSQDVGHEWNMISLDGEYYHVDCTWGDPILEEPDDAFVAYDYFGLTTERIGNTHVETEEIEYPTCTAVDYNYYYYNGWWYETYDYDTMSARFAEAIENQEEYISFCFNSKEEYDMAYKTLFDADLEKLLKENKSVLDTRCSYTTIEELNQITINVVYK